jgi:hypothetical protein
VDGDSDRLATKEEEATAGCCFGTGLAAAAAADLIIVVIALLLLLCGVVAVGVGVAAVLEGSVISLWFTELLCSSITTRLLQLLLLFVLFALFITCARLNPLMD